MRSALVVTIRQAIIGVTATFGWPLAMSRWLWSDFYLPLAVLAAGLAIATIALYRQRIRSWFPLTWSLVAAGLALGIGQVVLTQVGYRLLAPRFPALREQVVGLYEIMSSGMGPIQALPIIVGVVVVEELVWRGVLLESFGEKRKGLALGAGLSIGSYTIAQLGTGSWALGLAALCCGSLWWAMRTYFRGLTAPVVTHLSWSLTVLVFLPLESI